MKKSSDKAKKCSVVINTSFDRELYNTVALINSIKEFAKSSNIYTIYILFYDKTKTYVKQILDGMQTNNIKIVCVMDFYAEYPQFTEIDKKLVPIFWPNIVKDKNLVFLSPNTIVQADIADIFDIKLDDKVVGCSYDLYDKIIRNNEANTIFNTDVTVVDVTAWKRLMLSDVCESYIIKNSPSLTLASLINVVCNNNIKDLGAEWNFQYWNNKQNFSVKTVLKNRKAKIINFVDNKPWIRPMMDKADIWWKYVRNNPLYEVIIYRNINVNFSDNGLGKTSEKKININYIFFDKLKNEVNGYFSGKSDNREILEKVMNDKNLFSLIRRYVHLAFNYMFLRSKRENIKNEMSEIYAQILNIISTNQL